MDERAGARLAAAEVGWLTTVGAGGGPQSSPIWFVWHDGRVHLVSEPAATKLGNIARHPEVSFHLEGAGAGDVVVTMEGRATAAGGLAQPVAEAYVAKYAAGFARLGTTPVAYFEAFSAPVVIEAVRWRVYAST